MYNTWWPRAVLALLLTCASLDQKRQTLSPSWRWEIHAQSTTPEELKERKTPEKSDGSKNQAWGPWGASSDEGEAREWASLAWLMQQVPGEHEEIIAIKWHGWDTARECCAVEMEMNAKYIPESSCVYCSAFRKAPGSLALQSVDVINRKTLCFWG